jgi:hypothetical protein
MSPFEAATGIAGLIAFTLKLIELLYGMSGSIPRSTQLLDAIHNLHHVLERVSSEYSMTISSFPQLELNAATRALRNCIQQILCTCTEYDTLLRKIRAQIGGMRQLKWKISESEREELDRRLEAGKSTLQILLTQLRYVVTQTQPSRNITCGGCKSGNIHSDLAKSVNVTRPHDQSSDTSFTIAYIFHSTSRKSRKPLTPP